MRYRGAGGKEMIVIIDEISGMCSALIDYLTGRPDISIHLSLSHEETLRLVKEIKPELVFFTQALQNANGFIRALSELYPEVGIYLIEPQALHSKLLDIINFRDKQHIPISQLILPKPINCRKVNTRDKTRCGE